MPKGYHHLTCLERCQREVLRTIGISHAALVFLTALKDRVPSELNDENFLICEIPPT